MPSRIAIVGGGPCGLTLARLLERSNIDYVVYERDVSEAPGLHQKFGVGGSLDLHGSTGLQALKQAGLLDEFNKLARWDATTIAFADHMGVTKYAGGENREAPEIDRTQLRQLLLNSVPAEKIHWDHAVKAVEKDVSGSGWVLKFANGNTASGFGLVVGADGAWSKVRSLLTPAKPVYAGKHFIEARISCSNPRYADASTRAGRGMYIALGFKKWMSIQQMADSSYRIYLGLHLAEDFGRTAELSSNTESIRNLFLSSPDFFANWATDLKEIIAAAEGPFRSWPLYSLPVEAMRWPRVPGVTLLGDAAHLTTPNGEGVNCAMYDSLVLAERIAEHCGDKSASHQELDDDLERAVAEYEEEMFPRAVEHIMDGNNMNDMMFADDAVAKFLNSTKADTY